MNAFRYLILLSLFPLISAYADNPTDSLTTEEFKAAGLDKLSQQELAKLNALWSRENAAQAPVATAVPTPAPPAVAATTPPPPQSNAQVDDLLGKEQVMPDVRKAPKKIESRLEGTFKGWYGSTVFHLENGQVWQQRIKEVQKYSPTDNPSVTVIRSLGGYRLKIDGYRQTCPVKRIK